MKNNRGKRLKFFSGEGDNSKYIRGGQYGNEYYLLEEGVKVS